MIRLTVVCVAIGFSAVARSSFLQPFFPPPAASASSSRRDFRLPTPSRKPRQG